MARRSEADSPVEDMSPLDTAIGLARTRDSSAVSSSRGLTTTGERSPIAMRLSIFSLRVRRAVPIPAALVPSYSMLAIENIYLTEFSLKKEEEAKSACLN